MAGINYDLIDDTRLEEDTDYYDVKKAANNVATRWNEVGSALRITPAALGIIRGSEQSPQERLSAVLLQWLRLNYDYGKHGMPTWRKLVEVIEDSSGGNDRGLALKIAQAHPKTGGATLPPQPYWPPQPQPYYRQPPPQQYYRPPPPQQYYQQPPSVEGFLQQLGIPGVANRLDFNCKKGYLLKLARDLAIGELDWRRLAGILGVRAEDVQGVDETARMNDVLLKWKEANANSNNDTYRNLIGILLERAPDTEPARAACLQMDKLTRPDGPDTDEDQN